MTGEELYPDALLDPARTRLSGGPLLLSAPFGVPLEAIALRLLGPAPPLVIDARGAGTTTALTGDATRALARMVTGLRLDADTKAALLGDDAVRRLRAMFGQRTLRALEAAAGRRSDWSLDEVLRAVPQGHGILIKHADALTARWAKSALWALRARAQDADPPSMVLLCPTEAASDMLDPEAAFFGLAAHHVLALPDAEWYVQALPSRPPAAVRELTRRVRGRPTLVALALSLGGDDLRAGWERLVVAAQQRAPLALDLAASVHPLAPRLLVAVARGGAPYTALHGAPSKAVAAALAGLRRHNLLEQPAPRRWQVADPTLEIVLERMAN